MHTHHTKVKNYNTNVYANIIFCSYREKLHAQNFLLVCFIFSVVDSEKKIMSQQNEAEIVSMSTSTDDTNR